MESPAKPNTPAPAGTSTTPSTSTAQRELTRQQRDQLFNEAAKGMAPEHVKVKPEDPLKKWWPQIKRKLKEGYSVRQIHDMTRSPKVGLDVSIRSLQRLITDHKDAQRNGGSVVGGDSRPDHSRAIK